VFPSGSRRRRRSGRLRTVEVRQLGGFDPETGRPQPDGLCLARFRTTATSSIHTESRPGVSFENALSLRCRLRLQ
jgi:hypothetical protein